MEETPAATPVPPEVSTPKKGKMKYLFIGGAIVFLLVGGSFFLFQMQPPEHDIFIPTLSGKMIQPRTVDLSAKLIGNKDGTPIFWIEEDEFDLDGFPSEKSGVLVPEEWQEAHLFIVIHKDSNVDAKTAVGGDIAWDESRYWGYHFDGNERENGANMNRFFFSGAEAAAIGSQYPDIVANGSIDLSYDNTNTSANLIYLMIKKGGGHPIGNERKFTVGYTDSFPDGLSEELFMLLIGSCAGCTDINRDTRVNYHDSSEVEQRAGLRPGDEGYDDIYDMDGDQWISRADVMCVEKEDGKIDVLCNECTGCADINRDTIINSSDESEVNQRVGLRSGDPGYEDIYDMDEDQWITRADEMCVALRDGERDVLCNECTGCPDINRDTQVNSRDSSEVSQRIGLRLGDEGYNAIYDMDGDQWITRADEMCVDLRDGEQNVTCPVVCGDGIVEGGEECDDGNTNNTDACANDCTIFIPTLGGNAIQQCSDALDNDADMLTDEADPGCWDQFNNYDPQDNDESDGTTECQDGFDNDSDGHIDQNDPECLNNWGNFNPSDNNEAM